MRGDSSRITWDRSWFARRERHVRNLASKRDVYDHTHVMAAAAAAHNRLMHALNGNTEAVAAKNVDDFSSMEIDLKKLFKEDHGPKSFFDASPNDQLLAWENEMAFHGYSARDNWGLRVNASNGKLHQILELLPSSVNVSGVQRIEKEPDVVLPKGRVFAGPEFARWRLRANDLMERIQLQSGRTLNDFVTNMETEEAKCYMLQMKGDESVGGADSAMVKNPDEAIGGRPKCASDADFGKIQGLYWVGVRCELSGNLTRKVTLAIGLNCQHMRKEQLHLDDIHETTKRSQNIALTLAKSVHYDWRELGVKVALYNLLREDFFCDPTGRQNVVPERRPQKTERFNLRLRCELQFSAVALSFTTLLKAYEEGGALMVDGEKWCLHDRDVVLVFLDSNYIAQYGQDLAFSLWTLAHLEYPLAQVVDSYAIRWGLNLNEIREGSFIRTAGLVDIPSSSPRRIVFCVKNASTYTLSMFDMGVKITYESGTSVVISSWNAGPLLDRMISCVLRAKSDLRAVFNTYTVGMVTRNDWLEIDSLVNLLVVRWSRQPEAVIIADKGKRSLRLERVSLAEEAIQHRGVPNGVCTLRIWDDYNDVSSVDATFSSRDDARSSPFIVLYYWSNASEFCFCTRLYYEPQSFQIPRLITERLKTGALGVLKRAAYVRVAFEGWKRQIGIGDEIVAPKLFRFLGNGYTSVDDSKAVGCVYEFIETFISTEDLSVSWDFNLENDIEISLTGIRTGPVYRNLTSWRKKWNQFSVKDLDTIYVLSTGWFVQKSIVHSIDAKPDASNQLQSKKWDHALACVDWVDQSDNIGSAGKITTNIQVPLPMRLFSSWQTELAVSAGWRQINRGPVNPFIVGWGLPNWRMNWNDHCIKATAVREPVINVMKAWSWTAGLWKKLDKGVNPYENYGDMA